METNNNALTLLKVLRGGMKRGGRVDMDMAELCRTTGLPEYDVRECLSDLEAENYLRTELTIFVANRGVEPRFEAVMSRKGRTLLTPATFRLGTLSEVICGVVS